MVKGRRLRRASATGVGAGSGGSAAVAACGRVCPGSLVAVGAWRKQAGPVVSSRITAAGLRKRPAWHHRPDLLGYARRQRRGIRDNTPVVW